MHNSSTPTNSVLGSFLALSPASSPPKAATFAEGADTRSFNETYKGVRQEVADSRLLKKRTSASRQASDNHSRDQTTAAARDRPLANQQRDSFDSAGKNQAVAEARRADANRQSVDHAKNTNADSRSAAASADSSAGSKASSASAEASPAANTAADETGLTTDVLEQDPSSDQQALADALVSELEVVVEQADSGVDTGSASAGLQEDLLVGAPAVEGAADGHLAAADAAGTEPTASEASLLESVTTAAEGSGAVGANALAGETSSVKAPAEGNTPGLVTASDAAGQSLANGSPASTAQSAPDSVLQKNVPLPTVPADSSSTRTSANAAGEAQAANDLLAKPGSAALPDATNAGSSAAPAKQGDLMAGSAGQQEIFARMLANQPEAKGVLTDTPKPVIPAQTQTAAAIESLARAVDSLSPSGRSFVVQTAVAPTVGHPQWSQAVGNRVLWLAAQNISSAEIRLDPPELGPMQVRITVNQDQVQVSFTSPHAGVREALDQGAARLREMFNEQGLNLDVDVSDQSFARRQTGEDSGRGGQRGGGDGELETLPDEAPVTHISASQLRLVDHYA